METNKLLYVKRWRCFFEQSNTFRDAFRSLGYEAFSYDISKEVASPDYLVDLFREIDDYGLRPTVFDSLSFGDAVFAFFPCIRFSHLMIMNYQQNAKQYQDLSVSERCRVAIKMHDELNRYYVLFNKLILILDGLGIPLIIENPYRDDHYLTRYFWKKPDLIDFDRRLHGDYYKKPTQFFFFGCHPFDNLVFEPVFYQPSPVDIVHSNHGIGRSLISPHYAERFIRSYLVPLEVSNVELQSEETLIY